MHTTQERTESLQSLLRGELAAIETYQQALIKVGREPGALELLRIADEHRDAADLLGQHIIERGARPDLTSGAWGAFARIVEGTAKLFGNTMALKALKEGEQLGTKEYESALRNENLDPECQALIRSTLLPKQRTHVAALDRLMESCN